jgi:hypothetical protein
MRSVLAVLLTSSLALALPANAGPHAHKPVTSGPKPPKTSPKVTAPKTAHSIRAPRVSASKPPKASKTTPPAVLSKGRPDYAARSAKTRTVAVTSPRALPKNPKLAAKLQGMLPAGLAVDQAALGFRNQGQFVAAVNVSRNLGIPFVDLKTAMVNDGLSLGQSIQRLKPTTDGDVEASRATRWANRQLEREPR